MASAFSWQNSISLCPASLRIPRPNLPVTPGVSWLPNFAFQSSIMKRTSFFWVLVLKGLAEKAMAPHSSTFAWKNPMDGGAWLAAVHGVAKSWTWLERLHFHFSLSCIGEGNGNPLQCCCLENPRDSGAGWSAVSGVAQSWTCLKRCSSGSSSNR